MTQTSVLNMIWTGHLLNTVPGCFQTDKPCCEDYHYNFTDWCSLCCVTVTELDVMWTEMPPCFSSSNLLTSSQTERRFQIIGDVNKINEQIDVSKDHPPAENIWQHQKSARAYIGSFKCPGCGKIYRWKQSMMSHYRNECGKEPQFLCPLCPYKCKQKGNLKSHVRIWHPQSLNEIFK
jgi:hypothetical protein